jgi:hypothetical protein
VPGILQSIQICQGVNGSTDIASMTRAAAAATASVTGSQSASASATPGIVVSGGMRNLERFSMLFGVIGVVGGFLL